jgi:hypothetical protein
MPRLATPILGDSRSVAIAEAIGPNLREPAIPRSAVLVHAVRTATPDRHVRRLTRPPSPPRSWSSRAAGWTREFTSARRPPGRLLTRPVPTGPRPRERLTLSAHLLQEVGATMPLHMPQGETVTASPPPKACW